MTQPRKWVLIKDMPTDLTRHPFEKFLKAKPLKAKSRPKLTVIGSNGQKKKRLRVYKRKPRAILAPPGQKPMDQFKVGFNFFGFGDCMLFEEVPRTAQDIQHGQSADSRTSFVDQIVRRKFDNEYGLNYTGQMTINEQKLAA